MSIDPYGYNQQQGFNQPQEAEQQQYQHQQYEQQQYQHQRQLPFWAGWLGGLVAPGIFGPGPRPPFYPLPGPFPPGPPGPLPGVPGEQVGPPATPPPAFIPQQPQVGILAVDPGGIRRCLYRFTYIWLTNRQQFWYYPTFVGRRSIAGYRWTGFNWVYFGLDLQYIASFQCV